MVGVCFHACLSRVLCVFVPVSHLPACDTPLQSSDVNAVPSPSPQSITSSLSNPVSLNTQTSSSTEVLLPRSPSQPASGPSEPRSAVDVALEVLSSRSSLPSESARVMPRPGLATSPLSLGFTDPQRQASSLEVPLTAVVLCYY